MELVRTPSPIMRISAANSTLATTGYAITPVIDKNSAYRHYTKLGPLKASSRPPCWSISSHLTHLADSSHLTRQYFGPRG
ncbi:hypothetical protein TRIATDRAFT_299106 [Trichoderma atroviride IMI 206040]|uniref:Uncharacterized protein n=1 Tax=Hypocrea atroviridis (strain ATCC 20476 / IMI 206040) TaxID=452589 RepID=G9NSQ1_HYPAI|nr:uncharacterized protein TRIATDRAFT_299106 [Trichoderma atroviride IMI 206040]EHK46446.1 hypothetical protein TRIATDRAFT_299106 [Trichoderma atroviride IMI 206040]